MRWYQRFFSRGLTENKLDAELRFHLEQQIADYVASGMTPEEARRRALLEFGSLDRAKEECRDVGDARVLWTLIQDLGYGLRMMRKSPGFTAVAVLTLALGIGANTAIFSAIDAVLFKPLPASAPQDLVDVYGFNPNEPLDGGPMSYPDYRDFRDQVKALTGLSAVTAPQVVAVTRQGESQLDPAQLVTSDYFDVLGVKPFLGRTFDKGHVQVPGGEPYIVLSYRTWEREFGSDHQIVGKTVRVNGALLTIIGVAPPGFEGLWRGVSVGLWVPLTMDSVIHMNDPMADRSTYWLMAVGRLRPGTSLQQLRAELSTVAGRLAVAYPKTNKGRSARALPLNQVTIMPAIDKTLRAGSLVLLGFVGLVLLLTCANLAGTLLARGATRRREIALRTALGAGRVRLIRQLLTENLLLSLLGGALALLLPALLNVILPRVLESLSLAVPLTFSLRPGVDVRVLGFTLTVVMATTFLFGLLPAIKSSQVTLASSLNESPDTATGSRKKYRTLNVLVVGQTAVSLVLLICAALSLRSVWNASRMDPGFDPAGIVTASFLPSRIDYSSSETKRFYRQIVDRLRVLPGVLSTGLADKLPLTLGYATAQCAAEGRDSAPEEQWLTVDRASVGPGYFETMRIPILRGRAFNEQDSDTSGSVAIVNQTLASLLWPGQDPIAQRLRLGGSKGYFEVVGVARDGKYRTLGEQHRPYVYLDLQQSPETDAILVVRTAGDPRALLGPIREVSRGIDPRVPMTDLESLKQKISVSLLLPRLAGEVFGLFGLLGLVLACVGLYGVVAYTVSQHTHEIGVRLALGAERGDISRSVIGRGLSPVLLGMVLGLAGASGVTRLLATILYGVSATDPLTIAGVTLLLLSVALAACYIPAWRATRVEPLVALRYE